MRKSLLSLKDRKEYWKRVKHYLIHDHGMSTKQANKRIAEIYKCIGHMDLAYHHEPCNTASDIAGT